jgi:hypothetical protein
MKPLRLLAHITLYALAALVALGLGIYEACEHAATWTKERWNEIP